MPDELQASHDRDPDAPVALWPSILHALRGSRYDYTEGSIGRAVLLLAIPMVMEMAMESLFAVVDIFFVSRLGADAVAAVGITESMIVLLFAVAMGLSIAATATVARRIGEGNPDKAASTAVQAIFIGVSLSTVIGLAGALCAPDLLQVMGASDSVVEIGSGYTRVMFGGNVTIMLLFLVNAVFRGAGDAAIAMRVLWVANTVNIVLDPCLIFGLGPFPELGVTGAAVATNTGRGIGVLLQLWSLFRGRGRIQIRRGHLELRLAMITRILRLAVSGMVQVMVGTASWLALIRILTTFGSGAVAGYTIGIRIIIFALLPSWGMSNSAATMVGQSLGAGKPDRGERAVWIAGFYNMVFLGTVGVLFIFFARSLVLLFTSDVEVLAYAVDCLRIVSCGFLFYAYGMVVVQAFNGAGDTFTPTIINLFCFWLWEIPLAYVLAQLLGFGPRGVFLSIMIAFSTIAVIGILIFRRGRWKEKRV